MAASAGKPSAVGETLDRVVASIGNDAITASEVEEEYRFELFLEGNLPTAIPDDATFTRVRDRLVSQKLLRQEAETESSEQPDLIKQAAESLDEARRRYAREADFQAALQKLGMTEQQVLKRLEDQALTMWLIDQRLRPAAWVERSEIETYYAHTFVPEFSRRGSGPAPPLDEVESQIREILVQQKIDQLLAPWLEELKTGRRVRFHSF